VKPSTSALLDQTEAATAHAAAILAAIGALDGTPRTAHHARALYRFVLWTTMPSATNV
jgi:hypothetical protein